MQSTPQLTLQTLVFWRFGSGSIAGQVALIVVAVILQIHEARTVGESTNAAASFLRRETAIRVGLIDAANRVGHVVEFLNDGVLDFAESDDHADHQNRGNKHEFGGDDKAGFFMEEAGECFHRVNLNWLVVTVNVL